MNIRELRREFFRKAAKLAAFKTVKGNVNTLVEVGEGIVFSTEYSNTENKISEKKIREMIRYFAAVRTVTRKELEKFTAFSSAAMGLLITVLKDKVKIFISRSGLVRITLKGIKYVFAGCDRSPRDMRVAKENGAEWFLMSYYHIKDRKDWKKNVREIGVKLIIDSGAFSAWNNGSIVLDVYQYIEFLKENADLIHGYFSLDVVGDPEASKANYEIMKAAGLDPYPVFHAGSDLSILAEMVESNLEMIGIGGTVKMGEAAKQKFFTEIFEAFPAANFHCLGGGSRLMAGFEWFSADSTALKVSRSIKEAYSPNGRYAVTDGVLAMALTALYLSNLGGF